MKTTMLAGASLLFVTVAASAQTAPAPPTPATGAVVLAPVENPNVLRTGTKVPLKMAEELTTKGKKLRVGQRFQLEVAESVMLNGQVVIPAGTPAVGEITEVRNKGMWGKSGRIGAQLLYLRVNGRQIRLSGSFDDKGVTGTAAVVGAVVLVPVAGFFMTGTSAKLPLGGAVTGFLDEDVAVSFAALPPPPPLVVGAPAPASPVVDAAYTPPSATSPTDEARKAAARDHYQRLKEKGFPEGAARKAAQDKFGKFD